MRLPSVLDLLLVEGVGDLLLLAAAGDRLCQLLGGESAHLPLLLPLLLFLPSLLAGLLLPAPTSLPLLLLLLSLIPALLPPLLSRLPTEVLLLWVLFLPQREGGEGEISNKGRGLPTHPGGGFTLSSSTFKA